MSPSRPFILRPVATSLLMAGMLLAGFVAYKQLPVSALPEVDYPTIQVLTFYPGASPEVMASSVTAPLERQFGQVPGLKQMTSTSSFGSSVIVLQFALELNIDVAEQQVQASINAAATFLPPNLPNPPIYSKSNPADAPILTLALTSDAMPLSKVEDYADTTLGAEDLAVAGRGAGQHQRRPAPCRADSGEPDRACLLWLEPGGSAAGAGAGQRESGQGQHRNAAAGVHHRRQRSAASSAGLRADHRGLPQRRAGAAVRCRDRDRRRREHAPGGVDEHHAGRDSEHPAAARSQHHRRGGPRDGSCCRS